MFVDARSALENTIVEYDLCIMGAGAAGITLAREFNGQKIRVCLLESGGFEFDLATQSLYEGRNTGPVKIGLDLERIRYFGGTTNLWAGFCRPMDEEDFEERDWVPNSGWPFRKSELAPYYQRAHKICQLGPFNYDINAWISNNENCVLSLNNGRLVTRFFQLVPDHPHDLRRFGQVYRDDIRLSPNITAYLYANVTNIFQSSDGASVTSVLTRTISGNKFLVSARIFILATGAIENARLLLLSNDTQSAGIGNARDLVGRYFMAHLELEAGIFVPSSRKLMQFIHPECRSNTVNWRGETATVLSLSEELRRRYKLVNFTAELDAFRPPPPPGVQSLHELAQAVRYHRIPDHLITHLGRILADGGDVAAAMYGKMRGEELGEVYRLHSASETVPNPNSRVTLSSEKDQLNCNRVVLNWALSPIDTDSLYRGYEVIGQELGRSGLGRLKILLDTNFGSTISQNGGAYWSQHHHMGTTRMHADPKKGVVNADCQVHEVSNLFIAGSSVFPTSSCATPTLTIIALAVRLADHIKEKMR